MLNKCEFIGRLGKDPELKVTASGMNVVTMGVATTESWKEADGTKKSVTQWHNLVLWGKNAETASKYMKKGELHYFEGTLKYNKYHHKTYTDLEITSAQIHVNRLLLLPQKGTQSFVPDDHDLPPGYTGGGRSSDEPNTDSGLPADTSRTNYEDDIPF